jgi:hypothetical protein
MTVEEVISIFEERLDHLTDYMGGLHQSLLPWFDLLLALAEKGHLDYNILYKTRLESKLEVHPAVEEWLEENLEALKSNSKSERSALDDETLLQQLRDIFDQIFFNGALPKENCPLRIIRMKDSNGNPNVEWTSKAAGDSQKIGHTPDNRRSQIRIYESLTTKSGDRLKNFMNTLLHEMIHSIKFNYCCRCPSCKESYENLWGLSGHGPGWIKLSRGAEDFAKKMLNIKLEVGVETSVPIEIYTHQEKQHQLDWRWAELEGLKEWKMMRKAERYRKWKNSQDPSPTDDGALVEQA